MFTPFFKLKHIFITIILCTKLVKINFASKYENYFLGRTITISFGFAKVDNSLITSLSILIQPWDAYFPKDSGLLFPCINSPVGVVSPVLGLIISRQIIFGPNALGVRLRCDVFGAVLYGYDSMWVTILTPECVGVDDLPLAIRYALFAFPLLSYVYSIFLLKSTTIFAFLFTPHILIFGFGAFARIFLWELREN